MNSGIYQNNIVVWKKETYPILTAFGYQTCIDLIDKKLNISLQQCKKPEKIEKIKNIYEIEKNIEIAWRTIICNKHVDPEQLQTFKEALIAGDYSIKDTVTTKIARLSFYSDDVKTFIKNMCEYKHYKIIIWSLTTITSAFSDDEIVDILENALNHKSKEIRSRAAEKITYFFESPKITSLLKKYIDIESNPDVKATILYAIDVIDNKKIVREGNRLVIRG